MFKATVMQLESENKSFTDLLRVAEEHRVKVETAL
jgi:hypothetical protein